MTVALVILAAIAVVVYLARVKLGRVVLPAALWRQTQEREVFEHVLKCLLELEQQGERATVEVLAGVLSVPRRRLFGVLSRMETSAVLQTVSGGLQLTAEGRKWAVHIMRAHRLWERYLSDDAGMAIDKIHGAAHQLEHRLSADALEALDAHLGHPLSDPHGDPIPRADGSFVAEKSVPLLDWPTGQECRVIHIEDEPEAAFRQLVDAGLRPGMQLRLVEQTPQRVLLADGEKRIELSPLAASNISVGPVREAAQFPARTRRLSQLSGGESAVIVAIDPRCRGFNRRRMLDFGFTPGTAIQAQLNNPFGDPRGFKLRGTLVALRQEQAAMIWVRPLDEELQTAKVEA